jgi:hypothetical protein
MPPSFRLCPQLGCPMQVKDTRDLAPLANAHTRVGSQTPRCLPSLFANACSMSTTVGRPGRPSQGRTCRVRWLEEYKLHWSITLLWLLGRAQCSDSFAATPATSDEHTSSTLPVDALYHTIAHLHAHISSHITTSTPPRTWSLTAPVERSPVQVPVPPRAQRGRAQGAHRHAQMHSSPLHSSVASVRIEIVAR